MNAVRTSGWVEGEADVFAAPELAGVLRGCRVVTEPAVAASASDHLPMMAEFGLEP